jgi:hypothetical protein
VRLGAAASDPPAIEADAGGVVAAEVVVVVVVVVVPSSLVTVVMVDMLEARMMYPKYEILMQYRTPNVERALSMSHIPNPESRYDRSYPLLLSIAVQYVASRVGWDGGGLQYDLYRGEIPRANCGVTRVLTGLI